MTDRPWRIDVGLAAELTAAVGWAPADGLAALAACIPQHVLCGSTAKLAAMAAGEVPPGAAPDDLVRQIVAHLDHRAGRPAGGAPSPSWSCWVTAAAFAAVVEAAELGPVRVAATRRIDGRAPTVDLHAAVAVDLDDGSTWLCDPYFGVAAAAPTPDGQPVPTADGLASVAIRSGRPGRGELDVHVLRWDDGLRYRVLAPELDRDDVHAMAAISVTYSGVPARPYARLHLDGTMVDGWVDETGTGQLARWRPGSTVVTTEHTGWPEVAEAFAAHTGVRPT